ncbi:hypothetical protein NE865_14575 [Phthorimaea operculella]|nr:hypothetical protein NE865_14575 [Phthorimaea operculella]
MQKADPEDEPRSRPTSRRNSCSSRRSSIQKERKKSPSSTSSSLNSTPKKQVKNPDFCVTGRQLLKNSSLNSTPKKQVKNPDFCVTGRQLLKKSDRANSLPVYQRRPSGDGLKTFRKPDSPKTHSRPESQKTDRRPEIAKRPDSPKKALQVTKSRDTSLEDDMSLDLSQVSDFEDSSSKYGVQKKFAALATSTPKNVPRNFQKPRSASVQVQKVENPRRGPKTESRQSISTFCSRDDLLYKSSSSASNYTRYGPTTELDYSSVSPEYSGQSSADLSPRNFTRETDMGLSPRSQELHVSSCCISTWQDCSDTEQTKVEEYRRDHGEWNSFWANYNNSVAEVPVKSYYDQCPTPYRTEDFNLADLDFSQASSRKRSPDGLKNLNNIIRNEGLHLTPRETQSMIKCAHILVETKVQQNSDGNIDGDLVPSEEYRLLKKKSLTLNLKETVMPLEVKEEKTQDTVTTQTDISLPNTKSAPRIFEKILRQLSKTSLEESLEKLEKKALESKELEKKALENRELKRKELENKEQEKDEEEGEENNKAVLQT